MEWEIEQLLVRPLPGGGEISPRIKGCWLESAEVSKMGEGFPVWGGGTLSASQPVGLFTGCWMSGLTPWPTGMICC